MTGPAQRARALGVGLLVFVAAVSCTSGSTSAAPSTTPASDVNESGLSIAAASGPTLIVLSLDPGAPGENTIAVDVRNSAGAFVIGSVRVDAQLDATPLPSLDFASATRKGSITLAHAGHAQIEVAVLDGRSAGASATFSFDLPAEPVPATSLANIDAAMKGLHTLREEQTLSAGGPELLYHFEYQAPDRARYTTVAPSGVTETRLIGRDRYDRPAGGSWTKSDLGFPSRVPYSDYARGATRIRALGRQTIGGVELVDLAFVQGDFYYRMLVGARDDLVRSYTMFGRGHFMKGTYSDYDARLSISAP